MASLGSPHLVEHEARVSEVVHHLELEVNGVDPVPEGRFVNVLRNLPDGDLLLVDALVSAVRATFANSAACALPIDVSLGQLEPTLDVGLEHIELGLPVGPELLSVRLQLPEQGVALAGVLLHVRGEVLQARVEHLRLVQCLTGEALLLCQHCLLPRYLFDSVLGLVVELRDNVVHALLEVLEARAMREDLGVVGRDRILDRLPPRPSQSC